MLYRPPEKQINLKYMKALKKIMERLGATDQAKAVGINGTYSLPVVSKSRLWFDKIRLPNYPVSTNLKRRYNLEIDPNAVNRRGNKYLEYQFKRLEKSLNNPKLYFTILGALIKRSRSFHVSFINSSLKGWYQNMRLEKVVAVYRRLKWMYGDTKVRTSRFYITKPNGKLRPIGSPSKHWKVYLSMWAWGLSFYLSDKLTERNHGFRPGRGLWTAWLEILTHIKDKKNIYEFDLEKFFNTIRLRLDLIRPEFDQWKTAKCCHLKKYLYDTYNIPYEIAQYLAQDLNKTPPKLRHDVCDFNTEGSLVTSQKGLPSRRRRGEEAFKPIVKPAQQPVRDPFDPELWEEFSIKSKFQLRSEAPSAYPNELYGLTQGSPLSPILAVAAIDAWEALRLLKSKLLAYADDGLLYDDELIDELDLKAKVDKWNLGVKVAWEKSGHIKRDGRWLKPLTFLGSTYDPWADTLNDVPLSEITDKNLFKIVGKTYHPTPAEEWDWDFVEGSLLRRITTYTWYDKFLLMWTLPRALMSGYNKWDYNLDIKASSTVCCALLLHGLKNVPIRKVGTKKRKVHAPKSSR